MAPVVADGRRQHIRLTVLNMRSVSRLKPSSLCSPLAAGFDPRWLRALQTAAASAISPGSQASGSVNVSMGEALEEHNATVGEMIIGFFKIPVAHSRSRRAAGGEGTEHSLLYDLTHSFHLGSMIILSMLLLEVRLTDNDSLLEVRLTDNDSLMEVRLPDNDSLLEVRLLDNDSLLGVRLIDLVS